jgi:hypothetical protein
LSDAVVVRLGGQLWGTVRRPLGGAAAFSVLAFAADKEREVMTPISFTPNRDLCDTSRDPKWGEEARWVIEQHLGLTLSGILVFG